LEFGCAIFFGGFFSQSALIDVDTVSVRPFNEFSVLSTPKTSPGYDQGEGQKSDSIRMGQKHSICQPSRMKNYYQSMANSPNILKRLTPLWRAIVEIAFIVFLFYSNLLMGEFEASNQRGRTLAAALRDTITPENFSIAIFSALIGYLGFEYLRKKL
jgi:hypothetical protein